MADHVRRDDEKLLIVTKVVLRNT